MSRERLFAGFFLAVFVFLLYQFYRIISGFLVPLAWAALLALMFHPLQARLIRLLRGRRGVAAFVLTTAVIGVVMVPMVLLSMLLAHESFAFYQGFAQMVRDGGLERYAEYLRSSPLGLVWARVAPILDSWNVGIDSIFVKASNALSTFLASEVTGIARNVVAFTVNFLLTTVALFFFFRDGPRMIAAVRDTVPMEPEHKDLLLDRLYDTLSAVVQGTLLTAAAQGLLAGLGFWAVAVPFAAFLGCVTAFISLLPFGTPLVWGSVVIYLLLSGSMLKALLLFLWGALVISSIDNLIRPIVIGGRTEIPTVLLFFGILGGLRAYGFLGVFLAPAVIAILVAVARIYREQYGTSG
jgi:predicted PurR-regulated permease PerM